MISIEEEINRLSLTEYDYTIEKNNQNWYNAVYKSKSNAVYRLKLNEPMEVGKFYKFQYSPITKNITNYDKIPNVLVLQSGSLEIALNLNHLNYSRQAYIIKQLYKIYKNHINDQISQYPNNAKNQKGLSITYEDLVKLFPTINISTGIRNYLPYRRMQTACISFENIMKIPYLKPQNIK